MSDLIPADIKRVEDYCAVLWQWLDLIVEKVAQEGEDARPSFRRIAEAAPDIRLAVRKSSYLGRRLYGGEEHRTDPCPVHKGEWSGLPFGRSPSCGCDLTGWLPSEPSPCPAFDGWGDFTCDLPRGHKGPHRESGTAWVGEFEQYRWTEVAS